MPKKKKEQVAAPKPSPVRFQIINMTQKMFPVPYFKENGKTAYLNLRLQKRRRGQRPPVLAAAAITPAIRRLEQKGYIALKQL